MYREACRLDELPMGRARGFQIDGTPVALVRTVDGVHAIRDMCSHADVPLSDGDVVGDTIECWMHGSAFDLLTGNPLTPPAVQPVPVYQTRVVADGHDPIVEVCLVPRTQSSTEETS